MTDKKTYVKPHKRSNPKSDGKHHVKGHTRRITKKVKDAVNKVTPGRKVGGSGEELEEDWYQEKKPNNLTKTDLKIHLSDSSQERIVWEDGDGQYWYKFDNRWIKVTETAKKHRLFNPSKQEKEQNLQNQRLAEEYAESEVEMQKNILLKHKNEMSMTEEEIEEEAVEKQSEIKTKLIDSIGKTFTIGGVYPEDVEIVGLEKYNNSIHLKADNGKLYEPDVVLEEE